MAKKLSRHWPALLLALSLPMAVQAVATDNVAAREAGIASAHAGMAFGAKDLKVAHMHLHHVVNCLVGPAGKGFDANEANPCKGTGQGAIVDAKGDATTESMLHAALAEAEQGLQANSLDVAHADAGKVMKILQGK